MLQGSLDVDNIIWTLEKLPGSGLVTHWCYTQKATCNPSYCPQRHWLPSASSDCPRPHRQNSNHILTRQYMQSALPQYNPLGHGRVIVSAHRSAKSWQQHHEHMAPAGDPQQAQRAQRFTQPAVAKHLKQHEGATANHQDLANLTAAHA